MVSRLVLVCQYPSTLFLTRKHKKTQVPIAVMAITYFVAAAMYFGLFFTFKPGSDAINRAY
jgi:hypothetical protein